MKRLLSLAIAAVLAAPTLAAERYTIDGRHTIPVFEIDHLGFSTQRGRFEKVSGEIALDSAARRGSIEVVIDAASISMGLADWDKHMRSEEFFNVERFPTMRFSSDKLVFRDGKPVAAEGSFTLLGVSKPLTLKIANFNCGVHPLNRKHICGADATATIKRSEFGMTKYVPRIGDEVKLLIPVEAMRVEPPPERPVLDSAD